MKRWIAVAALFGLTVFGELQVNPLFTSHMVIQRDRPVAVYGTADADDTVTVEFSGQVKSAVADVRGKWLLCLDPMPASSDPQEMTVRSTRSSGSLRLSDILIGDVWLCAGQSNMATLMKNYPPLNKDIPGMTNQLVRLFKTKHGGVGASEPSDQVVADEAFDKSWQQMSPEYAEIFSATACFFGRSLEQKTGVPVGLLYATRGGTEVNMWLSLDVMQKKPVLYGRYLDTNWPEWVASSPHNPDAIRAPAYLYNGTIHPLIRFTIRGVIWYQGESDAEYARDYSEMFKDLIVAWRTDWGYEFPFIFVQLAPYGAVTWDNTGEAWAWQREAQASALKLPMTEMAVITDAGEYKNIHPQKKQIVGERLAKLASAQDGVCSVTFARSPMKQTVRFKDGKAFITFTNTADGLQIRQVALLKNSPNPAGNGSAEFIVPADILCGFRICGSDRKFVDAQAVITDKNTVCVWSDNVKSPVAVRYGWANFPLCNLYNSAGVPASPFRTDSFDIPDFSASLELTDTFFELSNPKEILSEEFAAASNLIGWGKSKPSISINLNQDKMGVCCNDQKDIVLFRSDVPVKFQSRFHLMARLEVDRPNAWGGIAFNYQSPDDFYVLRFCSGSVQIQLIHFIKGNPRVLEKISTDRPLLPDVAYRFDIYGVRDPMSSDGTYLLEISEDGAKSPVVRKIRRDTGSGTFGGLIGAYIGTPSDRPFFTYSKFCLNVQE